MTRIGRSFFRERPLNHRIIMLLFAVLSFVGLVWLGAVRDAQADHHEEADEALQRTRKQVQMLDDIYKGGIVLITTHYVDDDSDLPAGTAFKMLFEAAKKKGWHEVRLLDATGEAVNDENLPADDFEKTAIAALKKGKPYYDEVVERDNRRYLRAATIIPVVMEKCTMCHANYEDVEPGAAIGALGYTVPIE